MSYNTPASGEGKETLPECLAKIQFIAGLCICGPLAASPWKLLARIRFAYVCQSIKQRQAPSRNVIIVQMLTRSL